MNAKNKKKLSLNHETVRLLTDREVVAAVGGATRRCTNTDACTDTCLGECTGATCLC